MSYLLLFLLCMVKDFVATLQVYLISKLRYSSIITAGLVTLINWAMTVLLIIREDRLELVCVIVAADMMATSFGIALLRGIKNVQGKEGSK